MTLFIVALKNLSLNDIAKNIIDNYGFDGADYGLHIYLNKQEAKDFLILDLNDPQELKYKIYEIMLSEKIN